MPELSAVDVVVPEVEDGEDFVLTEEMRLELREADESAKRGESVDMEAVLVEVAALWADKVLQASRPAEVTQAVR